MTFPAALWSDRITTPRVVDGPINGAIFLAWIIQFLVPTLKPGDVVVLDNLGSHKGKAVRRTVRAAGAHLLFLPPYSPDLNPIEMMFAKLKALLRKADERSVTAVSYRIGDLRHQLLSQRMRELPQARRMRFCVSRSRSSGAGRPHCL